MSSSNMRIVSIPTRVALLVGTALIFYVWFVLNFSGGESLAAGTYRMIAEKPVVTQAVVTEYHFQRGGGHNGNFDRIKYSFKVDGREYQGRGEGAHPEGSKVSITYRADKPALNCLGSPRDHLRAVNFNQGVGFFVGTGIALFFALPMLWVGVKGRYRAS